MTRRPDQTRPDETRPGYSVPSNAPCFTTIGMDKLGNAPDLESCGSGTIHSAPVHTPPGDGASRDEHIVIDVPDGAGLHALRVPRRRRSLKDDIDIDNHQLQHQQVFPASHVEIVSICWI
jgi:hypothetical protein